MKRVLLALLALATMQPALAMEQISKLNDQLIGHICLGNRGIVHELLAKGANPNTADGANLGALALASAHGEYKMCELLIRFGAELNPSAVKDGWAAAIPLIQAAQNSHENVCRLLIHHKADPNAVDQIGSNALMSAASNNSLRICKLLIAAGAHVNALIRGSTALHYAAHRKNPAVCLLLLAHGADKSIKDRNSKTAYDYYPELCCLKSKQESKL